MESKNSTLKSNLSSILQRREVTSLLHANLNCFCCGFFLVGWWVGWFGLIQLGLACFVSVVCLFSGPRTPGL